MSPASLLDEGLRLLSAGYSVLPLHNSKYPGEGWKSCQDDQLTPEALKHRLIPNGHGPATGLALIIGAATWRTHTYLWVLDIEKEHRQKAERWLDKNIPGWLDGRVVETGDGGLHLHFLSTIPVSTRPYAWGEARGKNSIVVVPPTIHPETKKPYRWLSEGQPLTVDPLRLNLPGLSETKRGYQDLVENVVHEGEGRNLALTSLAGLLRSVGFDMSLISVATRAVNEQRCVPPLEEPELMGILVSINKYPRGTRLDQILGSMKRAAPADPDGSGLAETNKVQGAKMRALLSVKLRPEAPVLTALTEEIVQKTKAGKADAGGYVPVPTMTLAGHAGVGENTASRHMKKGVDVGLFERRYEHTYETVTDFDTGERRLEPVTRAFYRISAGRDLMGQLKAIADFTPAPGEERNHGGVRNRCKLHPDAPIISKKFCGECGELLEAANIDPATGKREITFEINPRAMPRKRNRRGK